MLERISELSVQRVTFGFETTLAGKGHITLLRGLRNVGYSLRLYFLWLPNADMAVERVAYRVARGGHRVEEPVVRRRYGAGIRNLWLHYRPLLERWLVFDNSGARPRLIVREENGILEAIDTVAFTAIIKSLEP